jgi:hypothetical protein
MNNYYSSNPNEFLDLNINNDINNNNNIEKNKNNLINSMKIKKKHNDFLNFSIDNINKSKKINKNK